MALTLRVYLEVLVSCASRSGIKPEELHYPEHSAPIAFGVKPIRTQEKCTSYVSIALGRDFRHFPGGGRFVGSWVRSPSLRFRSGECRSRQFEGRLLPPEAQERNRSSRVPASPAPAPPTESDGGGGAERPASGKRWYLGPAPPSSHQTLKPRVFTCRQLRRRGPER